MRAAHDFFNMRVCARHGSCSAATGLIIISCSLLGFRSRNGALSPVVLRRDRNHFFKRKLSRQLFKRRLLVREA